MTPTSGLNAFSMRRRAGTLAVHNRQTDLALALGLTWAVVFSFLGWLALMSVLAYQGASTAAMLAGFILIPAIGLWLIAMAGIQGGNYLLVVAVLVILVSDLSLRGVSTGLDAQSAAKLAIWASGLLLLPWKFNVVHQAAKDVSTFALLLFGLWALASTFYSISPAYTFAAALAFLGLWVTAVVLATSLDTARSLTWVASALLAMSVASLLLYVVAPATAMVVYENRTTLRLGGIFGNANALGGVAALALLLVVLAGLSSPTRALKRLAAIVVPVCLTCLILSQSRTAMLGLTAAVTLVFIRRHPLLLVPGLLLGAVAVVVLTGYPSAVDTLIALVARSGRIAQVTTFTGRTEIWEFVVSAIQKAPLLGYGFASTKDLIPAGYTGPYGWTTTSAHNLWLQTWVTTGGGGLLLVLASQLGSLWTMLVRPSALRDGVCVYVLFFGLLEPGPMGPSVNLLTFIWIWATASALRTREGAA
jgi:exopolysaccharide production protein ExoQ